MEQIHIKRIKNWKIHPSMRGQFAFDLYKAMAKNKDIFLLCGDLGYGIFDNHIQDFPRRAMSIGASEQTLLDIAVGLAYEGKIPFVYTITPFFYRGFETLRTYINHEKLPVKLCGSGRDRDYHIDGPSHDASDIKPHLDLLKNIAQFWSNETDEIKNMVNDMIKNHKPSFISLKR